MDILNIPFGLLPNELNERLKNYEQMRGLEMRMNDFIQQKMANLKEDMIVSGAQVAQQTRLMKLQLTVDRG